uniref:DUF4371 domain-containing protein n=1 Tax=Daphnia galeata TaxID=27404 RepID=A0A8J2RRF1_9CRUS|nr:unnamed protein product [Daphnia galeata]
MSDQQVKKRVLQSGSQYRLQKQRRSEENSKQGSALLQFLKPATSNKEDQQQPKDHSLREETEELEDQDLNISQIDFSDLDIIVSVEEVSTNGSLDAEGPATWPTIINEDLRQNLNEIISVLKKLILKNIIDRLLVAKYYGMIVDCTPDKSHQEQMSMILRFVDITEASRGVPAQVKICENFVGFLVVDRSDAMSLLVVIKKHLETLKIPLEDMRGQGYDNGANMSCRHNGVQNLNLVLNDAANCCAVVVSFFGVIQALYVFFSSSTKRWQVLLQFVPNLTLKPLSETRWESRIDAINLLCYQLENVYDALQHLANDETLINFTSKIFQRVETDFSQATKHLDRTKQFLVNLRSEEGFAGVIASGKELAEEIEVELNFPFEPTVQARVICVGPNEREVKCDRKNRCETNSRQKRVYSMDEDDFLASLPLTNIEQFEKFEKDLEQDKAMFNRLVLRIKKLGKRNSKRPVADYIRRAWDLVLSDSVSKDLNRDHRVSEERCRKIQTKTSQNGQRPGD